MFALPIVNPVLAPFLKTIRYGSPLAANTPGGLTRALSGTRFRSATKWLAGNLKGGETLSVNSRRVYLVLTLMLLSR